jgi:hypothetical protein
MMHDLSTQKGRNAYVKAMENQSKNVNIKTPKSKEMLYKEVLEDILNHIESGLISLESSGYLEKDIKKVLNSN